MLDCSSARVDPFAILSVDGSLVILFSMNFPRNAKELQSKDLHTRMRASVAKSRGKFVIPPYAGDQRANDCDCRGVGGTAQREDEQETSAARREPRVRARNVVGFSLHSTETRDHRK